MLEQINQKSDAITVVKVNVREHNKYASKQGVRSIPDTRIYYNQKKVQRFVGFRPKSDIERMIEPYLKRAIAAEVTAAEAPPIVESLTAKIKQSVGKQTDKLTESIQANSTPEDAHPVETATTETPSGDAAQAVKPIQPSIRKMEEDRLPPAVQKINSPK